MDKDYYLKLCLAVYRVTENFPQKEPLKYKLREKADDLLAILLSTNPNFSLDRKELFNEFEILEGYFELAKAQDWVDPANFSVLEREYTKIKSWLNTCLSSCLTYDIKQTEVGLGLWEEKKTGENDKNNQGKRENREQEGALKTLQNRQQKILEILRGRGRVQISELKELFPETSKRTLRRDLEFLLSSGLIKRGGEKNDIFYTLKD